MNQVIPKRVVRVIHPNKSIRTIATSVIFPLPEKDSYFGGPETEYPDEIAPMMKALWALPYFKRVSVTRGEISMEVTEAWEDRWEEFEEDLITLVDNSLFDGEAEIILRDDSQRYAKHRDDY